jgi:stringent starvation protein B
MHEWISDSECTPHIVVDASVAGVQVPLQYVRDGKIVLNVSWNATAHLKMGSDELSFSGRFGGVDMTVHVPVDAVLAIYARETGQGMIFTDDDAGSGPEAPKEPPPQPAPKGGGRRATLKVVK